MTHIRQLILKYLVEQAVTRRNSGLGTTKRLFENRFSYLPTSVMVDRTATPIALNTLAADADIFRPYGDFRALFFQKYLLDVATSSRMTSTILKLREELSPCGTGFSAVNSFLPKRSSRARASVLAQPRPARPCRGKLKLRQRIVIKQVGDLVEGYRAHLSPLCFCDRLHLSAPVPCLPSRYSL